MPPRRSRPRRAGVVTATYSEPATMPRAIRARTSGARDTGGLRRRSRRAGSQCGSGRGSENGCVAQRAGAKAVGGLEVRARSGERERRRRAVPPDARRTPGTAAGARRRREGSNSEDEQGESGREHPGRRGRALRRAGGPMRLDRRRRPVSQPAAVQRTRLRAALAQTAHRSDRCAHGRCRRRALGGAAGASSRGGPDDRGKHGEHAEQDRRQAAAPGGRARLGGHRAVLPGRRRSPTLTAGNRTGSVQWW